MKKFRHEKMTYLQKTILKIETKHKGLAGIDHIKINSDLKTAMRVDSFGETIQINLSKNERELLERAIIVDRSLINKF